ncbi:hypothetical protein [Bradyrhizobium sp. DASA03120]|uniref:hypothetical protein n=1 Tax=Bradyrhizobium sp. SMVTL-02 TaxID=3395917 RepID=UPI003F6E7EC2
MTALKLTIGLTSAPFDRVARVSYEGQAHFGETGPAGECCRGCQFWDRRTDDRGIHAKPARCKKFTRLTGKPGAPVPADAAACRYFSRFVP